MSGKGQGSGSDFESRVLAYVYVYILAQRALTWTKVSAGDVPLAVSSQTGGSGDDLRVEVEGSSIVYEGQAKRGLSAGTRFHEAVERFARGLPAHPDERGVLVVEPEASRPIRVGLRDALDRLRDGLAPAAGGLFEGVLQEFREQGAEAAAARLYVISLDVEQDAASGVQAALHLLEVILEDREQAMAAWGVLVSDGLRLTREGGRRDRAQLVQILAAANIPLSGTATGSRSRIDRIGSDVERVLAVVSAMVPPAPAEPDRFSVQLDAAKRLLDGGMARGALDLLRSMAAEIAESPVSTQVRHGNLVAAALLHLDDAGGGRAELLRVLERSPNDITALSNLAHAELMLGNRDEALSRARQVLAEDPRSTAAWILIVQVDAEAEPPAEVAELPSVLAARGFARMRAEAWDEAVSCFRRSIAVSPDEPNHLLLLGQALYGRAFAAREEQRDPGDVREAGELLDRAIAILQDRQDDVDLERALVARGQVARLAGDAEAAAKAFSAANLRAPRSPLPAHMLASLYMDEGEPTKALFAIERVPVEGLTAELHMVRARALSGLGRANEALRELERAVDAKPEYRGQSDVLYAVIEVAIEAGLVDFAEAQLRRPELDREWLKHLMAARIAARRGEAAAAIDSFELAIECTSPDDLPEVTGEFAEFLRVQGDTRRAAELLQAAGAANLPALKPLYARVLSEAQEVTRAAALVASVEGDPAAMPGWALQLGASVALKREDVPGAIRYLSALCARWPDNIEISLRLAHAYLRHSEPDEAVAVLDRVRTRTDVAPRQLLHLAELYIRAGTPQHALPLAYAALRAEPDAEDVQLAYCSVFLRRDRDERLDANEVTPGTAVTLRSERGGDLHYFITAKAALGASTKLSPDAPLARELLGKQVGDTIVLRPGAQSESQAEIQEIRSKYVYAFQDILLRFPERHPQSTELQSFRMPEDPEPGDFEFVKRIARARAETANAILDKYVEAGGLPLGTLAVAAWTNLPSAYDALAADRTHPFLVELPGSHDASREAASQPTTVVVTRSALITGERIGVLWLLRELHQRLVVPRSLIDEMHDERVELVDGTHRGYFGVAHVDGDLIAQEAPAAHFRHALARFDETYAWMMRNCEVLPRPLSNVGADDEGFRDLIGASSYDSVVLAGDLGGVIFADDWGLRRISHSRTANLGFSTYGLLLAAREAGLITHEQLELHTAELVQLGQAGFPMTAGSFRAALVLEDFRLGAGTLPLLERLRDLSVAGEAAVRFCVDAILETALAPGGSRHTGAVAYALIEAAVAGRDPRRLLPLIEQLARWRMQLLPAELDATLGALERYARYNVLGQRSLLLPGA